MQLKHSTPRNRPRAEERPCRYCGQLFRPTFEQLHDGVGIYCSRRCAGKAGPHQSRSIADRFWEKVNKDGAIPENCPALGQCWLWLGARIPKGYGTIGDENSDTIYAHRAGYEIQVGPIPEGLVLDHLCRNPSCVRGTHLQAVTQRENYLRGEHPSAVRARERVRPDLVDIAARTRGGVA
jgi:hypothetical protein